MQQFSNEVSMLTPSNEQMRELTMDEIQIVAGGIFASKSVPDPFYTQPGQPSPRFGI